MTPVLKDLHWLPVKQRIEYKVALVTHKVLETSPQGYLADLVSEYKPGVRCLRSATQRRLIIPTGLKSTAGQRTFTSASAAVWKRLPQDVRSAESLLTFKSQLKTNFFQTAFVCSLLLFFPHLRFVQMKLFPSHLYDIIIGA